MSEFDPQAFLRLLTHSAGVYLMIGRKDEVLYVGKARDLKKRVSTYFTKTDLSPRIQAMVEQITRVEINVTHTEDEALILESTLIKRYKPRYNVLLRDDKSYPYVHLSTHHPYPRLSFYRGTRSVEGRLFGPYPSAGAVRESLRSLQKVFRIRSCNDAFFSNRSRPCLQYQIKRCTAPCVGYISEAEYRRDVDNAVRFLEGRGDRLIDELVEGMEAASSKLEFEQAARYRDQVAALRRIQEQRYQVGTATDFDIVCCGQQGGLTCVVVVSVRQGRNLGHRSFFPRVPQETEIPEVLSAFLGQYYLERPAPGEILTEQEPADREWLETVLGRKAQRQVRIRHRLRGLRARLRDNARATLRQALGSRLADTGNMDAKLAALQEALSLETLPQRMECFDISHTGGEKAVASCVVFDGEGPVKSAYRRFNIEGIVPGDDYAAMHQAIERRFARLKKGEAPMPDILFIDGGRGQLQQAVSALESLQIEEVQLVAIAKGPQRKPGRETLFLPGQPRPLILRPDAPALHLIQQIRDEAHRFAVSGHRQRRARARTRSALEDIEGLGPVRRRRLLKAFGGIRQVSRAGIEDLARINGISRSMAQKIYDHFHENA